MVIYDWLLLFCCCVLWNSQFVACCSKRLGGNGEVVTFECNGVAVVWRHNGMELTGGEKYQLEQKYLTIRDIVGSDEGNYTCTQETHSVGCLLVYGKASFSDSNGNINVSAEGTVMFDFSLSFSQAGPSMNNQDVSRYCLKSANSDCIVNCGSVCFFSDADPHHWWTVEAGHVFVLHQAKSTDLGLYMAEVDVLHPKDDSIRTLSKTFHVTSRKCEQDYPGIDSGTVSTLESAGVDINGAQANYSCIDGCELQGSRSLRCRILVSGTLGSQVVPEWVNDTGHTDTPSCLCPTTTDLSSKTTTVATQTSVRSAVDTVILVRSSRSAMSSESSRISSSKDSSKSRGVYSSLAVDSPPESEKGRLTERITIPIAVTAGLIIVVVVVSGAVIVPLVVILKRRGNSSDMKKNNVDPEAEVRPGPDDDQTIDTDSPENRSVSQHSHSDYDDNISYYEPIQEFPSSLLNSREAVI